MIIKDNHSCYGHHMEELISLFTTAMNPSFFHDEVATPKFTVPCSKELWFHCLFVNGFFHHFKLEGKVNESWIERSIVFFRERTGFLKCWCLGYAMALLSLFLALCCAASSISMQKKTYQPISHCTAPLRISYFRALRPHRPLFLSRLFLLTCQG